MAITKGTVENYSDLKDAIVQELGDLYEADAEAQVLVARWVQYAEARVNRLLKVRAQERRTKPLQLAAGDEWLPLPNAFLEFTKLRLFTKGRRKTLTFIGEKNVEIVDPQYKPGEPKHYDLTAQELQLIPTNDDPNNTLVMHYKRDFQTLGGVVEPEDESKYAFPPYAFNNIYTTNWLLERSPDLLMNMSMVFAMNYYKDEAAKEDYLGLANIAVEQLKTEDLESKTRGPGQGAITAWAP